MPSRHRVQGFDPGGASDAVEDAEFDRGSEGGRDARRLFGDDGSRHQRVERAVSRQHSRSNYHPLFGAQQDRSTERIQLRGRRRGHNDNPFKSDHHKVFQLLSIYARDLLDPHIIDSQTAEVQVNLLTLSMAELKLRGSYVPTHSQLLELQAQEPRLCQVPTVTPARMIFDHLIHCRHVNSCRGKNIAIPDTDPLHFCNATHDAERIAVDSIAVYIFWIAVIRQSHRRASQH